MAWLMRRLEITADHEGRQVAVADEGTKA